MPKPIIFLLFLVLVSSIYGQAFTEWVAHGTGTFSDFGRDIAVDSNGNSFVVGTFFDGTTFGTTSFTSNGQCDVFIAKLDADRNWLWAKRIGGTGYDYGYGIDTDSAGNVYVTGTFVGAVAFIDTTLTSTGYSDAYFVKLDTNGNLLWVRTVETVPSNSSEARKIYVDDSGYCYAAGSFYQYAYFGATLLTAGGTATFVTKIDTNGNWIWAQKATATIGANGLSLCPDGSGNSYVTGFYQGTMTLGTISINSYGNSDPFFAKIDTDGNWLWAQRAGSTNNDYGYGISSDGSGNCYAAGVFQGTVYFGTTILSSTGNTDFYVCKLDPNGNWLWAIKGGGTNSDYCLGIATESSGISHITGHFAYSMTLGSVTLNSTSLTQDAFIARLDVDGNWIFAQKAGGSGSDDGYSITLGSENNIYYTGYFGSTATFGGNTITVTGSNNAYIATIKNNLLYLLSPNGGENWQVSSLHTSYWSASGYLGNVNIQFSGDNGSNWSNLNSSPVAGATGYYSFTASPTPSTQCLVRVNSINNTSIHDESDAVFTLSTTVFTFVYLTSPVSNALQVGQSYNINWLAAGLSNVNLSYSTNQGQTWITIASGLPAASGTYAWTVPNTPAVSCYIKVSDVTDPAFYDWSDTPFKICSLSIISPNGGEVFNTGSIHQVQWSSSQIALLKLEYSTDSGSNWTVISSSINGEAHVYNWTIPFVSSGEYLLRASDASNSGINDVSDAVFEVISFGLTYPFAAGIKVQSGRVCNITWESGLVSGSVLLELSTNSGTSYETVASGVDVTLGTYAWTVPSTPSTTCLIRMTDEQDPTLVSVSANLFIIAALDLLTPNGGEIWGAGYLKPITWTYSNIAYLSIEYTLDNGASWISITTSTLATTGNYNWTTPDVNSSECRIRISDRDYSVVYDISDSQFQIRPPILVTDPNGGELLHTNDNYTVTWTVTSDIAYIMIDYSVDNGSNWLPIEASLYPASVGMYGWTIPDNPSTQCLIKVKDSINNAINDISDDVFEITDQIFPPVSPENLQIEVVYPDIHLTWDPVTMDVTGYPQIPDGYIVMSSTDGESYIIQAITVIAEYTHVGAALNQISEFYYVIAYNNESGKQTELLENMMIKDIKIKPETLKELLKQ